MNKYSMERVLRQLAYARLWLKVPVPPNIIHVEPSGGCNLRCITCPQSVADQTAISDRIMSMSIFEKIVSQSSGFFKEMYFAVGGEPLLNPLLPEMIEIAKKAGLSTTMHSNATLMTRKKAEAIIHAGLDKITLNINEEKDSYEKIRQGAKHEKTLANIIGFLEAKRDAGKGPQVTLQSVNIYSPGMESAPPEYSKEFMSKFDGLPVDRTLHIWAHHFAGDFAKNAKVDYVDHHMEKTSYFPCSLIWTAMQVSWDGEVRPCCIDIEGIYPLGNVVDNTLRELWNGEKMVSLRRTLSEGKHANHPLCANCDFLWRGDGIDNSEAVSLLKSIARLITKKVKL